SLHSRLRGIHLLLFFLHRLGAGCESGTANLGATSGEPPVTADIVPFRSKPRDPSDPSAWLPEPLQAKLWAGLEAAGYAEADFGPIPTDNEVALIIPARGAPGELLGTVEPTAEGGWHVDDADGEVLGIGSQNEAVTAALATLEPCAFEGSFKP